MTNWFHSHQLYLGAVVIHLRTSAMRPFASNKRVFRFIIKKMISDDYVPGGWVSFAWYTMPTRAERAMYSSGWLCPPGLPWGN
jgi:hypothetical protein